MTWAIIYCIFSVIIVSTILIHIIRNNNLCTIGDLLGVLFLIVFSPISWIVVSCIRLSEKGFFKKVIWKGKKS